MSDSAGFNTEDIIRAKAGGGTQEPKIEELKSKLESLQQGKKVLEEEIMERKSLMQTEAFQLERTHQERKELSQKLQLQCEESEREFVRLAEQNKKSDELLAQHRYEIQELKLKRRKLRLKFEDQLHQLIKQHNQLYAIIKDSQPKT
ncbi:uncharacterized protein LOC109517115 isoform X2 [Hippocampus comes]|uniref:uncharacterized protein LOC109517115 isoform X2 n=1 Tax=Hippocampus comes TaxID=109280 RepID=UPI00094F0B87|nr:PREDICTED: uncharacterized protein LOC109517115 isoform X2 [Hippocampus comes]